ncbi:hypothetical protein ACLOJK_012922 [Asimina triloba]
MEARRMCLVATPISNDTSKGAVLLVDFENNDSASVISNEKEAFSRLRLLSLPLQDGACLHVKEGDNVLAMHKTQFRSLFFDARVMKGVKVQRVRHSSRIHCRCSFEIRWLHPELEGEILTVPSSAVRTLSENSIRDHPTVSGFLKSLNIPNTPNEPTPSYSAHLDDPSCELDIDRLVEGQIEEISKLVNASDKPFSEEVLMGVKKAPPKDTDVEEPDEEQQTEKESKDLPANQSTMEDLEMKSCLNPLAARAALASLMHELPQNPEISVYHIEKEGYVDTCRNSPFRHMDVRSVDMSRLHMNSDVCIQEKISMSGNSCEDDSLGVTQHPFSAFSNPILLSNSNSFGESTHETVQIESNRRGALKKMGKSSQMLTKKGKSAPVSTMTEGADLVTPLVTRFTESIADRKLNNTTIRRVTRSATREGIENSMGKFKPLSAAEDNKLNTSTITTGTTGLDAVSSTILFRQGSSIEYSKSNVPTITRRVTRLTNQRDREQANVEASPEPASVRRKLNNPTVTNETCLANQKEMQKSNVEVNLESMKSGRFSDPVTRRLTRSGNSIKEANRESSSNDGKLGTLNKTARVTCTTTEKDIGKSIKESNLEPISVNLKFDNPITTGSSCPTVQKRRVNLIEEATQECPTKGGKLDYQSTTRFNRSSVQKELGNIVIDLESSAEDQMPSGLTIARRLTRSMIQKEKGNSADVIMQESSVEPGKKLNNHSITRVARFANCEDSGGSVKEYSPATIRVTRSASHRDMGESMKEVSPTITRVTRSTICPIETGAKVSCSTICKDKEDSVNGNGPTIARLTRSAMHKDMGDIVNGGSHNIKSMNNLRISKDRRDSVKEVCLAGATTPYSSPSARRMTRSRTQKQLENIISEQDKEREERNLVQDTMALTNDAGTSVTADNRGTKRKTLSLPVDIDRNSSQRGRKRMKVSSTVVIIIDDEDETPVRDEGRQTRKKKTAAKKPVRFSPRLRFLPRTHSQAKRLFTY